MRQRWIVVIFWIILGGLVGAEKPSTALACSGSMQPIESLVEGADVVVKAEIVEIDDYNVNAIVHVESYLVGEAGAEYLPVVQASQQEFQAVLDGRGYCGLSASWWHTGENLVMFLSQYDDGSYLTVTGGWDNDYSFENETSTVDTRHMNDDGEYEFIALTETELRQEIAEISGQSPIEPLSDAPYPLHAPILIQTEQGSAYILPMDGVLGNDVDEIRVTDRFMTVMQAETLHIYDRRHLDAVAPWHNLTLDPGCQTIDCVTFTPHGSFVSFKLSDGTFQFCEVNWYLICEGEFREPIIRDGDALSFAPTSDAVAIWNDDQLDLYRIMIQRINYETIQSVVHIKSTTLKVDNEITTTWSRQHTVWSPDGRKLAFSDADGLWIWDVMIPETEPQLFIPAAGNSRVSIPLHFSPHGNYLAIEQDERTYTLEIVSGRELPYGIVSPDEQYMVTFVSQDGVIDLKRCYLTPFECYWGWRGVEQTGTWIDPYSFFTAYCVGPPSDPFCIPVLTSFATYANQGSFSEPGDDFLWYIGTQYQVEPISDNLLVLNDVTTISVGTQWITGGVNGDSITFDLEDQLDSDIVSVEWLSSMFLREGN